MVLRDLCYVVKLYRERQQEAWRLAAEGGLSILDAAKLVDQSSILKTTADIRRLEEAGAITYARVPLFTAITS
jgi:hypothetical protein